MGKVKTELFRDARYMGTEHDNEGIKLMVYHWEKSCEDSTSGINILAHHMVNPAGHLPTCGCADCPQPPERPAVALPVRRSKPYINEPKHEPEPAKTRAARRNKNYRTKKNHPTACEYEGCETITDLTWCRQHIDILAAEIFG